MTLRFASLHRAMISRADSLCKAMPLINTQSAHARSLSLSFVTFTSTNFFGHSLGSIAPIVRRPRGGKAALFILGPNTGADAFKTKALRVHLFRMHLENRVDPKGDLEVKPRQDHTRIPPKSQNDPLMAGGNGVKGGVSQKDREKDGDHNKPNRLSHLPEVQRISHFLDYFGKIWKALLLSSWVIIRKT
jgi:hypothetical protein